MAVVKNLMVRAGADFSAITKQSNKVKASMKGMQTSVSKSCSQMTSAASGMKKAFSAIGAVLSVSAIVSFGKEAKAAYDTQAEGEAKLAQAMRNTIGATDDEISAIKELLSEQQALGVIGDEVQLAGAQQLAAFVTTTDTLQQLIPILNDMTAQQYGLGATTENSAAIAKIFGKVLSGQTGALTRYGYSFTAAQEAVLKYGTEAEKAAVLAEVVGQKVGGMNSALASTPTGRLQQVSNTLGDIKEQFGAALSNVLVLFLPALKIVCTLLEKAAALAGKVAQTLANVFGSGPGQAAATLSTAGAVTDAMEDLEEAAEAAEEATNSTFGFDQITKQSNPKNAESEAEESSLPGAIAAGVDAADEAGESIGWLEAKLQKLQEKLSAIDTSKLEGALSRLRDAAAPLGEGLFSGIFWALENVLVPLAGWSVSELLPRFLDLLAGAMENLSATWATIQPALQWLWENFLVPIGSYVVSEAIPAFFEGLNGILDALKRIWQDIQPCLEWMLSDFLMPIAEWTGGAILDVLGSLSEKLKAIGAWCRENPEKFETIAIVVASFAAAWTLVNTAIQFWNTISAIATAVTTGLGAAVAFLTSPVTLVTLAIGALIAIIVLLVKNWDKVKEAAGKACAGIKSVWGSVSTWFSEKVIQPITRGFKDFANGILGFFEGVTNGAISAINKLIGAINKISFDVPDWVPVIGGKKFGFDLKEVAKVSLPRLATGAVIPPNNEFVAVLGDQTSGNNIEAPEALIRKIVREESGGKSSSPIRLVIPVYVGGRKITEKIIEDINDLTRTTGECPIMI